MTFIVILLGIALFIIYNFSKDVRSTNQELARVGGIANKYKELISYFDIYHPPHILNNDVNFYQMGWAGETTVASISIFEILEKVYIEFELQYNKLSLQRAGVDTRHLPPIHKKKSWSYDN